MAAECDQRACRAKRAMTTRRVLLSLILISSFALGQMSSLDRIRAGLAEIESSLISGSGKCGTPVIFEAIGRMDTAPAVVRTRFQAALQRPSTEKNRLSPSERFRIHYDTSSASPNLPAMIAGSSRVPDSHEEFVDSVAAIFDAVWEMEIGELGYEAPPDDNGTGGGNEYDIYIEAQSPGTFGLTVWELADSLESGARQRYPTYIIIDVDFLGERTPGIDGLRVTAAHEFHHAIQVGSYGIWLNVPASDFFFYELSAVWLEEVVFDEINDYYFDLDDFFVGFKDLSNRSYGFTHYAIWRGYERCVWALFLEKKYGRDIVRQVWDGMKRMPALQSMDETLRQQGSSLAASFAEFGSWNLFTGFRADTVLYYEEGRNFPVLSMNASAVFSGATSVFNGIAIPLSLQYYRFELAGDTVIAVIANTDVPNAYSNPSQSESFSVSLSSGTPQGGTQKLKNGLTAGFIADVSGEWRTRYLGLPLNEDLRQESFAAPNPLQLSKSDLLILPVDNAPEGPAEVFFLTPSLDLAYSGTHTITNRIGKSEVLVPTSTLRPHLSSGVHFIVLKTADRDYTWKVLVIR